MLKPQLSMTMLMLSIGAYGCVGPQEGRIVSASGESAGTLLVDDPVRPEGRVRGELPGGADCSGTFSQVSVDDLPALGAPPPPTSSNDVTTLAVLTCEREGAVRCTLARQTGGTFSFGVCKGESGSEYKVRF